MARKIIIRDTHRCLWYEDGVLKKVIGACRHVLPRAFHLGFHRRRSVELDLLDVRERDSDLARTPKTERPPASAV